MRRQQHPCEQNSSSTHTQNTPSRLTQGGSFYFPRSPLPAGEGRAREIAQRRQAMTYDYPSAEPTTTAEAESDQWVADSMFDAYNE